MIDPPPSQRRRPSEHRPDRSGAPAPPPGRRGRISAVPPMPAGPRPELRVMLEVDGDPGACLWEALADVNAWAPLAAPERGDAFAAPRQGAQARLEAAAARAPELAGPLSALGRLSREPGAADPAAVAAACGRVLRWAEAAGLRETALQFAEAAARVEPAAALRSYTAGRLCRVAGEHERARIWLERAARLARRAGSEIDFAVAHLGLGVLEHDLGRHAAAEPHLWKAVRAALRNGRRSLAGAAHHNLLLVQVDRRRTEAALEHARAALELYPLRHPRIPFLAHDVAFLLVSLRHFSFALLLLEKARPWFERRDDRSLFLATLARCAAAVRDRLRYERLAAEVAALAPREPHLAPMAWLRLTEGALAFGDHARAAELAARARAAAQARDNATVLAALGAGAEGHAGAEPAADVVPPLDGPVTRVTEAVLARLERLPSPRPDEPSPGPEDYPTD